MWLKQHFKFVKQNRQREGTYVTLRRVVNVRINSSLSLHQHKNVSRYECPNLEDVFKVRRFRIRFS